MPEGNLILIMGSMLLPILGIILNMEGMLLLILGFILDMRSKRIMGCKDGLSATHSTLHRRKRHLKFNFDISNTNILQKKWPEKLNPARNRGSNILPPPICSHHRLLCSMTNTSEKYERTQQGNLLGETKNSHNSKLNLFKCEHVSMGCGGEKDQFWWRV